MRCRISNALQHMPAAARFSVRGGGFWPEPYLFFSKPHRHSGGGGRRQTKTQRNQLGTRINKMGKERKKKRGKTGSNVGWKLTRSAWQAQRQQPQHKTLPAYVCVYNQGADGSVCPPIRKTNEAASSAAEQQYIYVSNSFLFFFFLFQIHLHLSSCHGRW